MRMAQELWAVLCHGKNGDRENRQEVITVIQIGNNDITGQLTGNDDGE